MRATLRESLLGALTALLLLGGQASALDVIRFGKAVPNSFAFGAAEVGVQAKIYEQEGIDLQILSFAGDARIQQALTADSIDIAVGSGPGLGFRAKGVPAIGVAAMYGPPTNLALTVAAKSTIKTVADLKGRRIGVTTQGSLTDWLTRELSRQQGWGSDGIKVLALGSAPARLAAMSRGDLDGLVIESATSFELEEEGKGSTLLLFGGIAQHFYTHVIFASDAMIDKRPDLLRRFLRGWFKTVAFMKANKDFTVKSEMRTVDVRESIAAKIYDTQIGSFSTDGAWDPAAIDVIRKSLKELGILDTVPDAKTLYNDKFVPVKF
jgi:ABC-type nitrate/sulfonate/bicarbonate transport system substrate-binding protein